MEKRKDSCGGFVDLEEAHDRLRIEELWKVLCECGVEEYFARAMRGLFYVYRALLSLSSEW